MGYATEIKEMLAKVETEQQGLKTGQIRLGNELQRLESDHKKWKAEQQRLQSDVEQRVIKCEGEISDLKEKRSQQESHTVVANPERFVQYIRRDYKNAMLCPFLWCEDDLQFKLDNIFTRLQIVSKTMEWSKLTEDVVDMTDVFRPHAECENPRVVLVEGNPAMGKSTFCQKLAHDWSLNRIPEDSSFPKVQILLLLKCRDVNVTMAKIQEAIDDQLLPEDVDRSEKENFFHFIRSNQSRVLLVLDGLDELNHEDLFQGLLPLIKGKVLPNINLLLTARPEMGARVRRYCDSLLQIVGYTKDDVNSYIEQYFRNHSDPSLAKKLKDKLADDDQLKELTTSPMNTALLCLLCEETNGIFPTKQTELYECLVSCAIRRYFAKRTVDLGGENPSEMYRDQLNQLGKMAFEALLKNRLYFSEVEMRSKNFLQLCFVTREPSTSKMKPTPCYAFAHKTFQEYFAALHLANQVLMDSKQGEALLWKLSPVDNWQVWKFLFPLVAKKDGERAVFVVSCLAGAVSRHAIPKPKKVIRSETLSFVFIDALKWELELSERERFYSDIVAKVLDAIASCEEYDEVLSDWQRKMLVKLAESIHLDRLTLCLENPRYPLAFSEYLSASCTLIKLELTIVSSSFSKLGDVLQSLHKLVHFELFISGGSSVGIFQSFPQSCSLLTRLKVIGKLSEEDVPVILDDVCRNQALTHLCVCQPGISDLEAIIFAKGFQTNVNLTHLTLQDHNICTVGFNALSQALHTNCVLTHLDLSRNALSDEVAYALSEALEINTTLTHLRLEHAHFIKDRIGPLGASALARALKKNSTLKWLLLGFNSIGNFGALAFADALKTNSTLTHLDLHYNHIGDFGIEAIFKALQCNHVMTHLGLGFNVISDSGAEALAGALQLPATQLSYLDLYGCKITSLGVEVLAGALRTNRSLIYLTLEETGISSSATALAEALQSNRTLTELNLCVNHIGNTEAIQLAQTLLDKNNTLAYLNLTDNRIGAKGKAELALVNQERCVIDFEDES
ncbi:protein NLRC3-like [Acropora millepora]|uniref:protein NLRC3-like n=1 Tax=Acropora millepora TaxID=45264 RepID=UPI001CF202BC|nr:protein NLRC3-like [Acropora millepora]